MLQLLRVQHRMQCHGQLQSRQPVCRLVTESSTRALRDRRCLTFRDGQISKQTAHRLIQAQLTYSMTSEAETPRKVVYKLGVTGSIGMGKSTVSQMFVKHGIPLWDADQAVHELYSKGGEAVRPVGDAFPGCIVDNGSLYDHCCLDIAAVQRHVPHHHAVTLFLEGIMKLESIVHPLVAVHRERFLQSVAATTGQKLVVLDIPLLFETHGEDQTDCIAVVSASSDVQEARVLARPGMTQVKFQAILKRQMPDEEKRRRGDYIIDTSVSIEETEQQVVSIIAKLQQVQLC